METDFNEIKRMSISSPANRFLSGAIFIAWFLCASPALAQGAPAPVLMEAGPLRVTATDIAAYLQQKPEPVRRSLLATEDGVGSLANELFTRRALAQKALSEGMGTSAQDKAALEQAREFALSEMLLARVDAATQSDAKVEAKARELYNADLKRFEVAERILARHVLIIPVSGDHEAARKKAMEVRALATAPGADFEALVAKYSDEPAAAERGGSVGYVTRDSVVAPFADAAFALKPGQVSPVVESSFGYHVIRVEDYLPAGTRPFDEVKEGLMAKAWPEVRLQARRELVEGVLKGATIHRAAVKSLVQVPPVK